jgi:hypothetical protein
METTQGISLYTYLYLKLAKMPYFSFYLLYFFSSLKLENKRAEQVLPRGRMAGMRVGRGRSPNNVYICK